MRISFIISVYNVAQWVERCLVSVRAQGLQEDEYEIIVVNDGSTDNTPQVVENLVAKEQAEGKKLGELTLINQENKGLSVARNVGFKRARGNYVWWIDGDDALQPAMALPLLERAERERLDVLCFGLNVVKETTGEVTPFEIKDQTCGRTVKGEEFLLKCGMPPAAWAAIYRRGFVERYRLAFLDGAFHEDQEFTPRAYFLARRIAFENISVYNFYDRDASITKSKNPKKTQDLLQICQRLWNFAMENTQLESAIRYMFINRISFLFSQALSNLCRCGIGVFPGDYKKLPYYPLSINRYLSKKERYKFRLINQSVPLYLKLYNKFVKPERSKEANQLRSHA